jgi:DNA-binding MarR family transcriptional regulator
VEDTIRQKLRDQFDSSLSRFDLMAQLERHPNGLTMGELTRRIMVSGGNTTAIVDQLENEKLVRRLVAPTDRRSFKVVLTPSGRKSFVQMAKAHEKWVVEMFGDLNATRHKQLHDLLGLLKASIRDSQSPAISKDKP